MRERLEKRLAELESEYATGQDMLAELDAKRSDLQQTLLRISGAAQVLRELLDAADNMGAGLEPDIPLDPMIDPDSPTPA